MLAGYIVLIILIATWIAVLTFEFMKSVKNDANSEGQKPLLASSESINHAISVNRDESILIGDKLGEVRITFLNNCDDERVRLGIVSPKNITVYRKEKDSKELLSDQKLYEKELQYWQKEIKRTEKKRREHESLAQPKVDNELLEGKPLPIIARKCNVSIDFVARRQAVLERAGSFDTPLFD